jgi:hypothetical protein
VNATRWALHKRLNETGLPVTVGSGAQTKYNRKQLGWDKAHWLDAAAVGEVGSLYLATETPLTVACKGQGGRQKAALNRYGYPIRHNPLRPIMGWRSGDVAYCKGSVGIVSPRSSGYFSVALRGRKPICGKEQTLRRIHRADGYRYSHVQGVNNHV